MEDIEEEILDHEIYCGYCPLCERPMLRDDSSDEHHLIPKTFKGKETITLHRICHQKLHQTFSEREMLHHYNTIERLLENEDIQKFVKWVSKKELDYYSGNKETKRRKSKRRDRRARTMDRPAYPIG